MESGLHTAVKALRTGVKRVHIKSPRCEHHHDNCTIVGGAKRPTENIRIKRVPE